MHTSQICNISTGELFKLVWEVEHKQNNYKPNTFYLSQECAVQAHSPLKGFTCIIILILLCLLVSRLLTACKILLQLGLAAVPDVSVRGEREMSKHLSDHHGAHAGATSNRATSPCQFRLLFKAQSGTTQWTPLLTKTLQICFVFSTLLCMCKSKHKR